MMNLVYTEIDVNLDYVPMTGWTLAQCFGVLRCGWRWAVGVPVTPLAGNNGTSPFIIIIIKMCYMSHLGVFCIEWRMKNMLARWWRDAASGDSFSTARLSHQQQQRAHGPSVQALPQSQQLQPRATIGVQMARGRPSCEG